MSIINERLKELRAEEKLYKNQLSLILGLFKPTICHYKSGYTKPNLDAVIKLADFFDASTDYLLGRKE